MDIDDLRLITAVAKYGSMNRAAAGLHVAQSSVTARIRHIEEELGVRLFIRHNRGVQLSDAGSHLLSYSDRILALFSEAIAAVKEDGVPKGSLRIGSTEPTVSVRLPQIVANFSKDYPAVKLSVTSGNTPQLIEHLLAGKLDGAFVAAPVTNPELSQKRVFEEQLVLVSHVSQRSIEDLMAFPDLKAIVLDLDCSTRARLSNCLTQRGINHDILAVASFDAIRSCVQSGLGVTLLPKELYERSWRCTSLTAHELPEFEQPAETLFICKRHDQLSSALATFLERSMASSNLPSDGDDRLLS